MDFITEASTHSALFTILQEENTRTDIGRAYFELIQCLWRDWV